MKKYLVFLFTLIGMTLAISHIVYAEQTDITVYPQAAITLSTEVTGGTGGSLYISNNNSETASATSYKTYLLYDLTGIDKSSITEAHLEAIFIQGALGETQKLQIYGIPDGMDDISFDKINWQNAPCNIATSATSLSSDAVLLGELTASQKNVALASQGGNFASFLSSDKNNIIVLAIARKTLKSSRYSLASPSNKTYQPPVIKLKGDLNLEGYARVKNLVNNLPQSTTEQKLKKASLMWTVEDAANAYFEGLVEQAKAQLEDVEKHINSDISKDSGKRLFPQMIKVEDNPYIQGLESQAASYIANPKVYEKSWEFGVQQFPYSKNLRSEFSNRLETASFLFTQNSGAYSKNENLLKDIFNSLEALCYYHKGGNLDEGRDNKDSNMNRFVYSSYNVALLNIMTAYPDIILPSVKQRWLNCVSDVATYQINTFNKYNTKNPHGAFYYANMDSCYTALMGAAGEILDNDTYRETAVIRSERLEEYMLGDGGWPYLGYANETPTYHQVNIHYLTYYYMITGNSQTMNVICKSEPYYPLTIIKNGLTEYSTVPYFKQYWDMMDSGYIEVVAHLAQSGKNRYIAQNILDTAGSKGSVFGALFYNPDIQPVAVDKNTLLYDKNIMGPRGNFDSFSYYANGRDWKDDRGKPTLVGAVAVGEGSYPSKGFFQNAYGGVYDTKDHAYHLIQENTSPKAFDMTERHAQTNDYALWENLGVSAFGSVYRLQKPQAGGGRSTITPYGGDQMWIMFPDKIIGIVKTNLGDETTAFGMEGVLQFGEGRGNTALNTDIQKVSDNTYTYDGLKVVIHSHNYNYVTTEQPKYTDTSVYGPVRYIKFNDTDLSGEKQYSKGEQKYYVAEIGIKDTDPATVDVTSKDGLDIMTVVEKGDIWYVYHNTTNTSKTVVAPDDIYVVSQQKGALVQKGETVTIPAYEVVLSKNVKRVSGFYYGKTKAKNLVPGQNITFKKAFNCDGRLIMAIYYEKTLFHIDISDENELNYKLLDDVSKVTVKGFMLNKNNLKPYEQSTILTKDDN